MYFLIPCLSYQAFKFPKAELLWECTECSQNMVHLCPLGNDSTTLSKVNFGVHSSSLDGLPSTQLVHCCLSGVFNHHYPGIPFASLLCLLFPVSHNFHFLGFLPLFGGVSSSSFLRSDAWEVNIFFKPWISKNNLILQSHLTDSIGIEL